MVELFFRCDGSEFNGLRDGAGDVLDGASLSAAAASVWAKSLDADGRWLPLWQHLKDTAAVAERLWDAWLPASVRHLIGAPLPGGEVDGRALVRWLAGVHDIGKATPAFAVQDPELAGRMESRGLRSHRGDPARKYVPHATAGLILLERWLAERYGWTGPESRPLTIVVGGHHGVPPTGPSLRAARDHESLLGLGSRQQTWQDTQVELLDRMVGELDVRDRLHAWRAVRFEQPAQVVLTAIVIVADWIASNNELFPYDVGSHDRSHRLDEAWDSLELPGPWRARDDGHEPAQVFASRFVLPAGAAPRPVQAQALELARTMSLPGALVVEAPMGEGKTELAFAVAEVMAARTGAGGCYIALPTMATSNAMFTRLREWIRRLPADGEVARTIRLAHGKAALEDAYTSLFRRGEARSIDPDGEGGADLVAHWWLSGRKKAMLASFAVGTIDQLLFASLKARHLALRHLGLAGKVVIIDEAHAYDVYMSQYLDRALHWLGAYGVPVVILSATLPVARRREMLQAYERGRTASVCDGNGATVGLAGGDDRCYPVLIATGEPGTSPTTVPVAASGRVVEVSVERFDDDLEQLGAVLQEALSDGGCALVVRNTVGRVQEAAACLRKIFGPDEVTVAHSRFLAPDRAAKDRWLRETFGPPDPSGSTSSRPFRHVVVASQVVEQSLDLDFDLLVTDVAPVDLLLQRLGRVHRHARGDGQLDRPPKLRRARCLLTGVVDWTTEPPVPVDGSRRVYGPYLLLRTLAVLQPVLDEDGRIELPRDIAPLVQTVYGDDAVGPNAWQVPLTAAQDADERRRETQRAKASTYLLDPVRTGDPDEPPETLLGWLKDNAGDVGDETPKGKAMVRDSAGGLEVIVVVRRGDGVIITPPWLDRRPGTVIPTDVRPDDRIAKDVARCTLTLPLILSHADILDDVIAELEKTFFVGWQESKWLEGVCVLALDEDGRAGLAGYQLHYDPVDGLHAARHEE